MFSPFVFRTRRGVLCERRMNCMNEFTTSVSHPMSRDFYLIFPPRNGKILSYNFVERSQQQRLLLRE